MLVSGTRVSLVFIADGDLRAADRAVRASTPTRTPPGASRRQGEPSDRNHWGTTVPGLRRAVAHDLRRAHGARGRVPRGDLLDRHRRAARADLGLRRRLAGPHPGADQRRAVRVPVPAAGDRRRVPAVGHDRQRHRRDGDRDHGRLRPAVLPSRASVDAVGARSHLHRGGARHGRAGRARSSAATCSATSSRACR